MTTVISKRWRMILPFPPAVLENAANVRKNLEVFPEIKIETNEQNDVIEI